MLIEIMRIQKSYATITIASIVIAVFTMLQLRTAPTTKTHSEQVLSDKDSFAFVRSMDGTQVDDQLQQASTDVLIVDAGLRRMFDYYLAATGEKTLPEIRAEIEKELSKKLGPKAAAQAKDLLSRYLDYKLALAEIEKNPQLVNPTNAGYDSNKMTSAIKARLAGMQTLRQRYFDQNENTAFFGFDDAYDTDAITRLEIAQDKNLNNVQKQQKLQALDAAMPAALRAEKEAPYQIIRMEENVAKMRAQGASDDDIYRMRAAATTPEAAARLADLDREDTDWKNRIATYQAERNKIISNGKNDAEQMTALQQIRNQLFDVNEQKRLGAYE